MKKIIRKILNKINSLLLVVFAGVLIMSISLNGTTFAWFYDSTVIKANGGFQMAELEAECVKDDVQKLEFINFGLRDLSFAREVINLERNLFNGNAKDWNTIFKDWWTKDGTKNGTTALKSYLVPTNTVLLGNIIRKEYTFTNTSNVPVYLRVTSPKVTDTNVDVVYFVDVVNFMKATGLTEPADYSIEKDKDSNEFYYFHKPMMEDDVITIEVIAYVPQFTNVLNWDFIGTVDIFIDHAEIIQATNNAVYYVDGWKGIADQGLFKSYTDN